MAETNRKKRAKRFTGKNIIAAVLVSLSLTLTVSILTPLDVILNNQRELPMLFSDYAGVMILPAGLMFAAVLALQMLALAVGEKTFRTVSALFLGMETAMCVQQLFLNGKLTVSMEGTVVEQLSTSEYTVNNIIFLEVMLIFPVIALYRAKKEKQAESFFGRNTGAFLACGLLMMQASGFLTSYINNHPQKYAETFSYKKLLSFQPTLSFSKEKNIIVFLTDRFDGIWCDEMLEEYPELNTRLEGFTYYRNNMSPFELTFPSLVSFLTHHQYDGSGKYDYLQKCWQGENALSDLRKNGFTVNLLPDAYSACNSLLQLEPYCDNLVEPVVIGHETDIAQMRSIMYQLAAVRLGPYVLKACFSEVAELLTGDGYVRNFYDVPYQYTNGYTGMAQDMHLYEYLQNASFRADSEKPVFSFIHLNFAHDENPEFVKMLAVPENKSAESSGYKRAARAGFEIIFRYFEEAKALGVYDNTTFIIMADHGIGVGTDEQTGAVIRPSTASLMIKPENAERVPLKTDSETPLYNEMFSASVLDYAGIEHSGYGVSFREAIETPADFVRELTGFNSRLEPIEFYTVEGNARDAANWKRIK